MHSPGGSKKFKLFQQETSKYLNDELTAHESQLSAVGLSYIESQHSKNENQMKKTPINYLKEYTCLEFSNFMQGDYTPETTTTLTFKGKCNTIPQELPHELIDKIGEHEQLIICKWTFSNDDFVILDLFEYFRHGCARLEMNYKPEFLHIVQGFLYVVGGSEIHVLELGSLKILASYSLGSDIIHAIDSAFPQGSTDEFGVWVYSYNEKKGYRKRFFSYKTGNEDRWWSDLGSALFSKKARRSLSGSVLKILIPNVLGLLLMSNQEEVIIFDLNKMEIIQSCTAKLTGWNLKSLSNVRVKIHQNLEHEGYDDSLLISIGEMGQEMIEIFIFEIKYEQSIVENYFQMKEESQESEEINEHGLPSITSFTNSEIVDWNNCAFHAFISYSTEGALIDYLLTETGIIFYSQTASKIPISGFVNYLSLLTLHPIICLEHNISAMHLKDVETYSRIKELEKEITNSEYYSENEGSLNLEKELMNSILTPNRYSIPFLYTVIGLSPINRINVKMFTPLQLLSSWYKYNRIRNLYMFNGDVIVVRENSITSFLPIGEDQFTYEYQNGDKMLEYLRNTYENEGKGSLASYELSLGESHYSNYLPIQCNDQIESIWEQIGKDKDAYAFTYEIEGQENIEDQLYDNHLELENEGSGKTNIQHEKLSSETYNKHSNLFLEAIKSNGSKNQNYSFLLAPESSSITRKCLTISKHFILNRVKDIIHFYSHTLKFLFSKINKIPSYLFPNQNPVIHKIMVRYLSSLDKLMVESLNQANAHETNLLENFIVVEIAKLEQKLIHEDETSKEAQNIIIDVEKESWKIIAGLFEDIVFESEKEKPTINGFMNFLINYVVSQYQYIEEILLEIFYPYPSTQLHMPIHENHSTSRSSSNLIPNISVEECHFPFTPTILNVYCVLPVPDVVRERLICSYILGKFGSNKNPELIDKEMMALVGLDGMSKNAIKEGIRNIHGQVFEGKLNREFLQDPLKTNSMNKSYLSNSLRNSFQSVEIDNSRGIIHLSKLLEPEALEQHLRSLSDEDLELIFKVSMQNNLQRLSNNSTNQQKAYDSEELLIGEVFCYRTYAFRLKEYIKEIRTNTSEEMQEEESFSMQKKGKAYLYIRKCVKSLENIRALYSNISKGTKTVASSLPNSKYVSDRVFPTEALTDEQLIKKLCVNAIGYDEIEDLELFPENESKEEIHSFILPTGDFLNLLENIIKDKDTTIECIANLLSVSFYYIEKILDNPYQYIQSFRLLASFFSSRQLSNLILKNSQLREKFYQLCNFPESDEFNEIKCFFGYSAVNNLSPIGHQSHSLNASNLMTGNNSNQLSASAKRNESNKKNGRLVVEENLRYGGFDYRNAYIEAEGS